MAEHEFPSVGSVGEEAARLLDALGGWAGTSTAGYAAGPAQRADARRPGAQGSGGARCESCGAENGVGQALTCQLCPLCQGLGILRSVRPETVDRLADLAGAVAAALREVATHRTGAGEGSAAASRRSSRVEDIVVEDDEPQAGTTP
jgi:hypothetical protein